MQLLNSLLTINTKKMKYKNNFGQIKWKQQKAKVSNNPHKLLSTHFLKKSNNCAWCRVIKVSPETDKTMYQVVWGWKH